MARAHAQPSQPQIGQAPDPQEWQALRSELIALLEQVEGRYIRAPRQEPGVGGIADRMRELRDQVAGVEPETRRREALRSVKRAVDRFTERDEPEAAAPPARSPRDALEAAISEIRARQQAREAEDGPPQEPVVRAAPPAETAPPEETQRSEPRFEDLARSVSGISTRLERLEVELKAQRHDQGSIRDIAEQVSQVSHVVELLAGAVGETGQVKRLESQIAGLARLISEGQRVDMSTLTQRLDDVSATVERLADLQIQHVSREKDMPDLVRRLDDVSATVERLADLQVQHVSREKDLPSLGAKLGEVSHTIATLAALQSESADRLSHLQSYQASREDDLPAIGARLGEVSQSIAELADRQSESAERLSYLQNYQASREGDFPAIDARLGQVSQSIAALAERQAESVAREKQIPVLGQQLGVVSASVERLVDLQTMHVRTIKDVPVQQEALHAGIQAIERSVRNVYDRIDAIEQKYALTPVQFEELTREMARFTQALQTATPPQSLLQLVDVLNSRMTDLESHDMDLGGLKTDISALRQSVIEAIEPRMAAIETRIEALNSHTSAIADVAPRMAAIQYQLEALHERGAAMDSVAPRMIDIQSQLEALHERGAAIEAVGPRVVDIQAQLEALNERVAERPADPSVGQIEAQVRQLVARMDQTGEQLTGLARLYSEASDQEPDYEAIAEMVAARTSAAMAQNEPTSTGITAEDMSELEERMSRLIKAVANDAPASPDFSDVTEGIRRVDERLERLELALSRLAEESAAPPVGFEPSSLPPVEPQIFGARTPPPSYAPPPVEDSPIFSASTPPPRRSDAMPASPAEDRPLYDGSFPGTAPMRVMLETRIQQRKQHPGLADDEPLDLGEFPSIESDEFATAPRSTEEAISPEFIAPSFNPETIERPQAPVSSFAAEHADDDGFASSPLAIQPDTTSDLPPVSSRSTFIEAARRAAQRQMQNQSETSSGSNSLIGRALARFQLPIGKPAAEKPAPVEKPVKAEKPPKAEKPAKVKKVKGRRDEPKIEPQAPDEPDPAPAIEPLASTEQPAANDEAGKESFLAKNRQPILLAASVVALSFLTFNLVSQRISEGQADQTGGDATPSQAVAVEDPAPIANPAPVSTEQAAALPMPAAAPIASTATDVAAGGNPRVIPMIDSLSTGSIGSAATKFTPSDAMPAMAQSFTATDQNNAAPAPEAIASPVKVDMPPESVGPMELRQAAADGDARAQFEVGAIYTEGRAVPKDLKLAAIWYERAAAQGFAPAQYRLGNLYENGLGVDKDFEQARLWYQRAAEAGNRMSMHNLAALYAGGELGKQDFSAASEWFEKAADQGLTDSQFNLGMLYARGLGVAQSMQTSYKWFALAARNGDKDAASARDDIAKSLDADTVSHLSAEVAAWKADPIDLAANFAPIGTWSNAFDPGEVIKTRDVVLGVQTLLQHLGYDVGTPDGVAGPKTADAIRSFEKATGMSESGAVNPRLLAVLSSQPV